MKTPHILTPFSLLAPFPALAQKGMKDISRSRSPGPGSRLRSSVPECGSACLAAGPHDLENRVQMNWDLHSGEDSGS